MIGQRKDIVLDVIAVACRLVLAIAFIWACVHKIYDPYGFAVQVATYQILPLSLVNMQAIFLPWIELLAGLMLVLGFWTRPAALITIGMNIMFIVAIALALSAELQLQCGCFASAEAGDQMTVSLIVRDAIFLVMGLYLVVMKPDRLTLDNWLKKS